MTKKLSKVQKRLLVAALARPGYKVFSSRRDGERYENSTTRNALIRAGLVFEVKFLFDAREGSMPDYAEFLTVEGVEAARELVAREAGK